MRMRMKVMRRRHPGLNVSEQPPPLEGQHVQRERELVAAGNRARLRERIEQQRILAHAAGCPWP
jgi:hypothetical protein